MKSYFVFLSRNKFFSSVEILSLSFALCFLLLFGNYVRNQFSITKEHPNYSNIYFCGKDNTLGLTFGISEPLKNEIPEIKNITRISQSTGIATYQDKKFQIRIYATNPHFFEIFPRYEFRTGSAQTLAIQDQILLSEDFASTLFPSAEEALGKRIDINGHSFTVEGIVKDFKNTLFRNPDVFIAETHPLNYYGQADPFDHFDVQIILETQKGTDQESLEKKVNRICKEKYAFYGDDFFPYATLTRLDKVYFDAKTATLYNWLPDYMLYAGDIGKVRLLSAIVLALLVSALVNYINLNTALSGNRSKEYAARRLLGESSTRIFLRQMGESVLFTLFCFLLALLLACLLQPWINDLLNSPFPVELTPSPKNIVLLSAYILVLGCLAGIIPAFIARKSNPIDIVQGKFRRKSKSVFSKIFIVLQNSLTVFLICMALVMEVQLEHTNNRPINANLDNKYFLYPDWINKKDRDILYQKLKELPCVKRIGRATGFPGMIVGLQGSETRKGDEIYYAIAWMDTAAFNMLEFTKLHDFNSQIFNSVWFTESAFYQTGLDLDFHDISQTLNQHTVGCEYVAGVIADIPSQANNMGEESTAVISIMPPQSLSYSGFLLETIGDHSIAKKTIDEMTRQFIQECFGVYLSPFYNNYCEDLLQEAREENRNTAKITEIFMFVAILISALGLLAMSFYYAEIHRKSNAIKKIHGISLRMLLWQNFRDYALMFGFSILIGIPVAVYFAQIYLESFIYRIEDYAWIFFLSSFMAAIISLLSVWRQTFRSLRSNPAQVLKSE